MIKLDEIHDFIEEYRLLNKIAYKKMGAVIGYSDVGFKKALINKTLSLPSIEKIINEYGIYSEYQNRFGNRTKSIDIKISNEDVLKVLDNWDKYMEHRLFKAEIEGKHKDWAIAKYNLFMKNND